MARQVRHASLHVGFFYLAGHGVPQAVVDAAFEASREFHAMPLYRANYFHQKEFQARQ